MQVLGDDIVHRQPATKHRSSSSGTGDTGECTGLETFILSSLIDTLRDRDSFSFVQTDKDVKMLPAL